MENSLCLGVKSYDSSGFTKEFGVPFKPSPVQDSPQVPLSSIQSPSLPRELSGKKNLFKGRNF